MQGAHPNIQIPVPQTAVQAGHSDEDMEKERRYKIQPLNPSRYLREIETGHIHRWSEDFGARSDKMEAYNPTLEELQRFGEHPAELIGWGYTAEMMWQAGFTAEQ